MHLFNEYSQYYDLLYRDKDYDLETDYVARLIKKHYPSAASILDLGCGTGSHDIFFAQKGYDITGIDFSDKNVRAASNKVIAASPPLDSKPSFIRGDIRYIRVDRKFDVVVSLFHVLSYQTTNNDLLSTFNTVKAHLKAGGLFIFDCWYGPAVLTHRPETRVKRVENDALVITRVAEPSFFPNNNIVEVDYHLFVRERGSERFSEIQETHRMRYLFRPELEIMLSSLGFEFLEFTEWMQDRPPSFETWSVCFVLRI